MFSTKTVLVTGGAGYIGSHIAYLLANSGYSVIILDNFLYGQSFDFPHGIIIRGDFGDKSLLKQVFQKYQPIAVFHCAAAIEVSKSLSEPLNFYQTNVSKTIALLQTMVECNIKQFIFSSSCAVYGVAQTPHIAENHSRHPINPYGRTKLMIEMILEDMTVAHDFSFVSLRYFNVAGELPEFGHRECHIPETHIIPTLVEKAHTGQTFTIFGSHETPDGTCIRDYVHVADIAQANLRALEYFRIGERANYFNIGTGRGTSVAELIQATEKITGTAIKTQWQTARAGDPSTLIADIMRSRKILGWEPILSDPGIIISSAHGARLLLSNSTSSSLPLLPPQF